MTPKKQTSKTTEQKPDEKWWQKGVKAFGVEAPILLLIGILIGIIFSYSFIFSKPDLFLQPAIAYAVRETLAVQSLSTLQSETQSPITTSDFQTTETPTTRQIGIFSGQQLVYDDFSSKIFTWSEGTVYSDNSMGYENGVYYLDINDPAIYLTASLWSVNNEIMEMENFAVQVDVLGPFYTDWEQKQGILFGYQVDGIGNSYAFDVSYDGTCRLVNKIDDGQWEVINSSYISNFDINSPHTITVTVRGSEGFAGYVDEQSCLAQVIDYAPGIFGVSGKISKNSGKLSFDNFYIFKIPQINGE